MHQKPDLCLQSGLSGWNWSRPTSGTTNQTLKGFLCLILAALTPLPSTPHTSIFPCKKFLASMGGSHVLPCTLHPCTSSFPRMVINIFNFLCTVTLKDRRYKIFCCLLKTQPLPRIKRFLWRFVGKISSLNYCMFKRSQNTEADKDSLAKNSESQSYISKIYTGNSWKKKISAALLMGSMLEQFIHMSW